MNITFENVSSQAAKLLKHKWKQIIGYLILTSVVVLVACVIYVFSVVVLLASLGILFGLGLSTFITVITIIISMLLFAFIGELFLLYVALIIVDREVTMFDTFKRLCSLSNFTNYILRYLLPMYALVFIYILLCVVSFLISMELVFLVIVIGLLGIFGINIILRAQYIIPLVLTKNYKEGKELMGNSYSKKDVVIAYLIVWIMLLVIGFSGYLIQLIPYIGAIIFMFVQNFLTVPIYGGFIICLRKQVLNTDSDSDSREIDNIGASEILLSNEYLNVRVYAYGAELKSVIKDGKEYMWQADSQYWGKTSPVLFPFVGRLKDDRYQVQDKMIEMKQHGFLRERMFTIKAKTDTSATFRYSSTLDDYEAYPVDFDVEISYELRGSEVKTTYKVINNANFQMPYQIGAHPGFNIDNIDNLTASFIPQQVTKHYFKDALQERTETVVLEDVELSYELINQNIPCFSNFTIPEMSLKQNGEDFIKFKFSSMTHLAMWSPEFKNAPFICVEPWRGICSKNDQRDYYLESKDAMSYVDANSSQTSSYSFEIC